MDSCQEMDPYVGEKDPFQKETEVSSGQIGPASGQGHVRKRIMSTYKGEISSPVAKNVHLQIPVECAVPVNHFKPRPPLGGCTIAPHRPHRKKQFVEDTVDTPKCFTKVFHFERDGSEISDRRKKPLRRAQSAKPHMTFDKNSPDNLSAFVKKNIKSRPLSAVDVKFLPRQASASSLKPSGSDSKLTEAGKAEKYHIIDLEPRIFGYKSQSYLSGKNSSGNLEQGGLWIPPFHLGFSSDGRGITDDFYKRKSEPEDDNISLTDLIDFEDDEEDDDDNTRSVPRTLRPLLPWLTVGVPQELIGVDPAGCMVFLPSLLTQQDLPYVPPPQDPSMELPFKQVIQPPQKHKKPKKYKHPWCKIPVEDHQCSHGPGQSKVEHGTVDDIADSAPRVKIYDKNGRLVHQSYTGDRTENVIRKEIEELEDLMEGIGRENGFSLVVQYQAEINQLRRMVNSTMGRVREIERREEEKKRLAEPPEPPDTFGLRSFYRQHDEIIAQIQRQHAKCVHELRRLTEELELESARCHFSDRLTSLTGQADAASQTHKGTASVKPKPEVTTPSDNPLPTSQGPTEDHNILLANGDGKPSPENELSKNINLDLIMNDANNTKRSENCSLDHNNLINQELENNSLGLPNNVTCEVPNSDEAKDREEYDPDRMDPALIYEQGGYEFL